MSGRGRGSSRRGRGAGRGSSGRGPKLPFALMTELGGGGSLGGGSFPRSDGATARGRGRSPWRGRGDGGSGGGRGPAGGRGAAGSRSASDAPDAGHRKRPRPELQASGDQGGRASKRPAARGEETARGSNGPKRPAAAASGLTRTMAAMQQRRGGGGATGPGGAGEGAAAASKSGVSSKTRFHELLVDGWESRNGKEAFLEELRLQAQLAKRLGRSKKDSLDGMDRLLGLLSAGSSALLPGFIAKDRAAAEEATQLLARTSPKAHPGKGGKRGAAAAAEQEPEAGGRRVAVPASAAAAARKAAELLEAESDEELEFLGIDPGLDRGDGDSGDDEEDARAEERQDFVRRARALGGESSDSESDEGEGDDGSDIYSGDRDLGGSEGEEGEGSEDEEGEDDGKGEDEDEDEEDDGLYGLLGGDSDEDDLMAGSSGEEEEWGEEGGEEGGEGASDEMTGSGGSSEGDEDEVEEANEGGPEAADGKEAGVAAPAAAAAAVAAGKYVPPALRAKMAAAAAGGGGGAVDPARAQLERRITGLVNRLAEANLQPISREVAELYGSQGRRLVAEAVAAQILGAAESGPRASEQFAAVAAAFVAAVAAQAGAEDLAAGFMAGLAERLEAARQGGDSLAQANLVTLLAYCYSAGLVGPGLCYSLLGALRERFSEADVSAMVTLLNAVGLQLRNADPGLMKEFVLGVHERAAALGKDGQLSRRAQLMLDLIIDIKNNKTSAAGGAAATVSLGGTAVKGGKGAAGGAASGAAGAGRRGGALAVLQPSVAKWLAGLGVDEVCLRGLTWTKLLAPNKKGMWWQPQAGEALDDPLLLAAHGGGGGAVVGGAAVGAAGAAAGAAAAAAAASNARLLALAAEQRMNTDARRAIFVAIMGSEDCAEAHEKLLRLPLKGDQRREVVRVLVECCLAEKSWNPYYPLLALRLCGGGGGGGEGGGGGGGGDSQARAHRVTLQYCFWDRFKDAESMDVRRLTHLARMAALLVARFALSLSLLKVVDWGRLSAKQTLLWRAFLQHLLVSAKSAGDVKEIFKRVASQPKTLSSLISGLLLFLRSSFAPWAATRLPPGPESDELLRRTRLAEKELAAGESAAAAALVGGGL
ncbi:hypothetical protein HYH02_011415 [Chlamydomonas schloesseri]|uniref:MI domain-containing protein n=1 Tax=Chlamydomonas schloesseri TaxID=2026947 RepID=A0A835T6B9_9CHLO|nr:hypothetical protein HYH02_011415 [Chlamydomonas schloesseri]|eukprot:KAG2436983.1 hypothetical protein HYH02_011415 [Chlamydomonas schloesseri]